MKLPLFAAAAMLLANSAAAQTADDYIAPSDCPAGPDKVFCDRHRADFKKQYPAALKGDYQSQRNVAFCLSTGCDGAVNQNRITGCAWRIVIMRSGSLKVDQSDSSNHDRCMERLSPAEILAASAQAETIFQQVYGRKKR